MAVRRSGTKVSAWLLAAVATAAAACGGGGASAGPGGAGGPGDAPPAQGDGVVTPPASTPAGPTAVDYLVVTGAALSKAAHKLADYRTQRGHLAKVVDVGVKGDTAKIRGEVKAAFDARDAGRPFYVLLVGDADTVPPATYIEPFDRSEVAHDNVYADMDGDHIPDLAVGRLAVSTEAEAEAVREKIVAYESKYEVGAWNRRLTMFASTGGFGEPADTLIEQLTFKMAEEIPYDFDMTLTWAKQSSPYVFVPERFSDKIYDRMNEGSLVMTYIGHGYDDGFASLDWNGTSYPILDTERLERLDVAHKAPILTLIACSTGGFHRGESFSERLLKATKGPIAILSSTEVSHPYANAIFTREASLELTRERTPTLGEVFRRAKRRSIENAGDPFRKQLDAAAAILLPEAEREALRRSHLYMYTLFGDPAMRVAYPKGRAEVLAPADAKAGAAVRVEIVAASLGGAGKLTATLEASRSSIVKPIAPVPPDGHAARDATIEANYRAANDRVLATRVESLVGGRATTTLEVPAGTAPGDYWVKIYAENGALDAVGSAKVRVIP